MNRFGSVAERLKAPVSKTGGPKGSVSSNLTASVDSSCWCLDYSEGFRMRNLPSWHVMCEFEPGNADRCDRERAYGVVDGPVNPSRKSAARYETARSTDDGNTHERGPARRDEPGELVPVDHQERGEASSFARPAPQAPRPNFFRLD